MPHKIVTVPRAFKRADEALRNYKAGRWIRRNADACVRDLVRIATLYRNCALRPERLVKARAVPLDTFIKEHFSKVRQKLIRAAADTKIAAIRSRR